MRKIERIFLLLFSIFVLTVIILDGVPLWKALVTVGLPIFLTHLLITRFGFLLGFILGIISWNVLVLGVSIVTGSLTPEIIKIAKWYLLVWITPLSVLYVILKLRASEKEDENRRSLIFLKG